MLSTSEIERHLKDRNLKAVSHNSGVSYSTIRSIRQGKTGRIAFDQVKKLSDYLENQRPVMVD